MVTLHCLHFICFQVVCEANEELLSLMHSGIVPLLKNVEEMIEKILLTMHNEDFSLQDKNQLQVSFEIGKSQAKVEIERGIEIEITNA